MAADVRPGPAASAREGEGATGLSQGGHPDHVFIFLEFDSVEDAQEAGRRLEESGVLDRFEDKHGPNVLEEAEG